MNRTLIAFGLTLILPALVLADGKTGEQIYKAKCALCHGAKGEGSKQYRHALVGDLAIPQLAKQVRETMPVDEPNTLSAEEAREVAAFVHGRFYSREAREKNKLPRIELARLTVRQYRNAVADLVGRFRTQGKWDEQRGLKAEYYKNRRFGNQDRVLMRTDPTVKFDFGIASPVAGKIEPHEFSIRWSGSVLAPETGEYEFVVRTEHATRLWLNDMKQPLIDAWVKSGSDTEYKGSIYLIGGRAYPLKLEYSKAKQGVDDSKKNSKPPSVKSSVALEWKRPGQAVEVIPSRNLSPNVFDPSLVISTPFPPDDRSYGWERGTTVSKAWDQAATDAALDATGYVTARINELAGTRDGAGDRVQKLRDFAKRFAEVAFRQPLSAEQKKIYIDRQFDLASEPEIAIKRVVLLVLKSPRFLYRELGGGTDSYKVAARLAFGLWDSVPDAVLHEAAETGKLTTKEQVMAQAERMLGDLRGRNKLRGYLHHWLAVDHAPDVAKDPRRFPGFDEAIISDLRTSLDLFLDEVVWSEKADFRQLLTANHLHLNGRLAKFYGVDLPVDADFQKAQLNPKERAGVLTHPFMMASFAYTAETSPIHRGVFLARGVLGLALRPPPEAVSPLSPSLHPSLTTRERVILQTKSANCMTCHSVINPLGFALEHFDPVGRYREKDNSKPIDAVGSYQTRKGGRASFTGAREMAKFLAASEEVQNSFAEQMFHHLVQQSIRAYGPQTLPDLRASFVKSDYNIRKLAVEVMATSALQGRKQVYYPRYLPAYSHIGSVNRANAGQPPWNRKPIP